MSESLKLFGYTTSPYVRKVACYLYYKGLPFEFVAVNPLAPQDTIGFSGGTQVPVLKIGEDWKRDSSPIGIWLDELYPEKPLLGTTDSEREKILAVDDWASESFIPGMIFRTLVDGPKDDAARKRGLRLAEIISSSVPLPDEVIQAWPDMLPQAPFIQEIANKMDRTEPLEVMQMRLFGELIAHLGDGPYLGGMSTPSLADFAIYPQMIFPLQVGLIKSLPVLQHPAVGPWLKRVSEHLPANPWCLDDSVLTNKRPFAA